MITRSSLCLLGWEQGEEEETDQAKSLWISDGGEEGVGGGRKERREPIPA